MSFDPQQTFSKEVIKARMLQNATKLWGLKNIQSLDPFVKLLIDAFSTEVFKANNEIQTINGRILERLAKLLTPTNYTHPTPAHAVAYCMPDEDTEILMEHSEFFYKKHLNSFRKTQSDRQVEIPFTPVENVALVKAQTILMVAGNTVYHLDEQLNKIPVQRITSDVADYRNVLVGIDVSQYTAEHFPETLSIYCSNPTYEKVDFVYRLLPHIKVFHQNIPLEVSSGIRYHEMPESEGYEGIFEERSIRHSIRQDVKNLYHHQFLEISGIYPTLFNKTGTGLPETIDDGSAAFGPFRNKKILWLKMEFPPQYTSEILENFTFVLNAFPVYNRGWKKTEYNLDIMGNNIPMETSDEESFLYVEEVVDGMGKRYSEIPFTPNDEIVKGLFTVRKGGMERFTQRNATDLMSHVMELLRDEVAAFAIINRDKVKDVLGEISSKMKGLMKKVDQANKELKEDVNYVIIEPLDNSVHTYASFWVCHSALANSIRPGSELHSQKKFHVITLLTESTGGAEEKKQSDTILAYKYALTSRDRIISAEDVKNYCRMMLNQELKDIKVKRGTMISDRPKEGFIRTVDVEIVPHNYSFYGRKYWDHLAEVLKNNIRAKAIDGVEYRVMITEDAVHLDV